MEHKACEKAIDALQQLAEEQEGTEEEDDGWRPLPVMVLECFVAEEARLRWLFASVEG